MARDFYPFVEGDAGSAEDRFEAREAARIAVYDDAAAAPRVVMVEAGEVRAYLEEITSTVARLAREQGGSIPFMVIREIVENFVHAYFRAPTITILDGGNTIRFSDRGPGIREKDRALEFGTSSATEEMKRYIRGVGSGLPYVQQYMRDKGGSLDIEDNLDGGTVVTISTRPQEEARTVSGRRDASRASETAQAPAPGGTNPFREVPGYAAAAVPGYPVPTGASAEQHFAGSPSLMNQPPADYPTWPAYPQQSVYGTQTQPAWNPSAANWSRAQTYQQPQSAPAYQDMAPQGAPSYQSMTSMAPSQAMPTQSMPAQSMPAQPAPTPRATPQSAPQPTSAAAQGTVELSIDLDDRTRQALAYLSEHGEAGPTDLVRAFQASAATWSRTLSAMSALGLVKKLGQKYRLTEIGRDLSQTS